MPGGRKKARHRGSKTVDDRSQDSKEVGSSQADDALTNQVEAVSPLVADVECMVQEMEAALLQGRGACTELPSDLQLIQAAMCGDIADVKRLVESKSDCEQCNGNGVTALHQAASHGFLEVVRYLAEEKRVALDPRTRAGCTPFYQAVRCGQISCAHVLLHAGADLEARTHTGATPMYIAADRGNELLVELLLAERCDAGVKTEMQMTPALIAAFNGHNRVLSVLASHGADLNQQREGDGATPLWIAAQMGHTSVVQCLLASGVHVDPVCIGGFTPSLVAAMLGYAEIVRLLLLARGDLNSCTDTGSTLAMVAARQGHTSVLKVVATIGSVQLLDAQLPNGDSAIKLARVGHHVEAAQFIKHTLAAQKEADMVAWEANLPLVIEELTQTTAPRGKKPAKTNVLRARSKAKRKHEPNAGGSTASERLNKAEATDAKCGQPIALPSVASGRSYWPLHDRCCHAGNSEEAAPGGDDMHGTLENEDGDACSDWTEVRRSQRKAKKEKRSALCKAALDIETNVCPAKEALTEELPRCIRTDAASPSLAVASCCVQRAGLRCHGDNLIDDVPYTPSMSTPIHGVVTVEQLLADAPNDVLLRWQDRRSCIVIDILPKHMNLDILPWSREKQTPTGLFAETDSLLPVWNLGATAIDTRSGVANKPFDSFTCVAAAGESIELMSSNLKYHGRERELSTNQAFFPHRSQVLDKGCTVVESSPEFGSCATVSDTRPWSLQGCLTLQEELNHYYANISDVQRAQVPDVMAVLQVVGQFVASVWPHVTTHLYGSRLCGFSLVSSDIDLVVMGMPPELSLRTDNACSQLTHALEQQHWVQSAVALPHASVPLVKLRSAFSPCTIDIAFAKGDVYTPTAQLHPPCLAMGNLMCQLSSSFPAMAPLVCVLKQYLRESGLNDAYYGGLSSTCLSCMVAAYLIHCSPTQSCDIGHLLTALLDQYSQLDYSNTGISLETGFFDRPRDGAALFIEDPLHPGAAQNIAYSCFAMHAVKAAFWHAHCILQGQSCGCSKCACRASGQVQLGLGSSRLSQLFTSCPWEIANANLPKLRVWELCRTWEPVSTPLSS